MKTVKLTALRSGKIAIQFLGRRHLIESRGPGSVFTVAEALAGLGFNVDTVMRVPLSAKRRRRRKRRVIVG